MEVLVKLEGCDWMILTESTQVNDTAEWTVKMEAYENAKAAIVQSDFNGDADAPRTWEDKRTLDGYFRSQMQSILLMHGEFSKRTKHRYKYIHLKS